MDSVDNSIPVQKYSSSPMKKGEILNDGHEDKSTNQESELTSGTDKSGMETEFLTVDPDQTLTVLCNFIAQRPKVHYKNCLPKYDEIGSAPLTAWVDSKKIKIDNTLQIMNRTNQFGLESYFG